MFEAFNELNQLQYSSSYQNYGFLSKTTLTLTKELWGWDDGLTTGTWNECNSSGQPIAGAPSLPLHYASKYLDENFAGISADMVAVFSTSPVVIRSSSFSFGGPVTTVWWFISSVSGATVEVYAFNKMEKFQAALPTSGVGLELYDAAGVLTYSSDIKPLRYISSHTISAAAAGSTVNVSGTATPSGKKYAYSIGEAPIIQSQNNGGATVQTFSRIIFPSPVNPRIYPRPNGTFTGAKWSSSTTGSIQLSGLAGSGFTSGGVSTGRLDIFDVTGY